MTLRGAIDAEGNGRMAFVGTEWQARSLSLTYDVVRSICFSLYS